MSNTLNFTTSINLGNLNKAKVDRVTEVDEDNQRLVVVIRVEGSQAPFYASYPLEVRNGSCGGVAAHPAPGSVSAVMVPVALATPGTGIATAFTDVLAAYQGAGSDKRANVLNALKAITGTVQGGPLDGQTKAALPAGTVS